MANPTKMKYKVILIGDGGVGKTSFIKKLLTCEFERKYVPTMGVEVHPITIPTNYGNQIVNIWDCAGQERFQGLKDGYFIGANGAIIMFDLATKQTFLNVPKWIKLFRKVVGKDAPIVICGNKKDINKGYVPSHEKLIFLSTKTRRNVNAPIHTLLKRMCGVNDLKITPSIRFDEEIEEIIQEEGKIAQEA